MMDATQLDSIERIEDMPMIRLIRLDVTDADAVHAELLDAGIETRFRRDRAGVHCVLTHGTLCGSRAPIVSTSAESTGDALIAAYRWALDHGKVAHCVACGDLCSHWLELDDGATCEACDAAANP